MSFSKRKTQALEYYKGFGELSRSILVSSSPALRISKASRQAAATLIGGLPKGATDRVERLAAKLEHLQQLEVRQLSLQADEHQPHRRHG